MAICIRFFQIGPLIRQPASQFISVFADIVRRRIQSSVLKIILSGVVEACLPGISAPLKANGFQPLLLRIRKLLSPAFRSLPLKPSAQLFQRGWAIVRRDVQMAILFVETSRFCVLHIPCALLSLFGPISPFHPDRIEPLNLVLWKLFSGPISVIDLTLLLEPFSQPDSIRFVIRREVEIPMLQEKSICQFMRFSVMSI